MAVARSDDGSSATRKKTHRKPPTEVPVTENLPPPPAVARRLDDLFRLAMPNLFKLAERQGIAEHTGMNRARLIVSIVRRQIERGEVVAVRARWKCYRTATVSPQRRPQLSGFSRRHLRLAQPDSPPRPAHRLDDRRADPPPR